jgi:allantoinase
VLRAARARGVSITAETCPHYLHFAAEDVADGATEFKCAPPIRAATNREILWRAILAGDLDFVVSDHSPCPPALKRRDTGSFDDAWGGIASLELRLPVIWTGAMQRGVDSVRIMEWLAHAPGRFARLGRAKGAIAAGYDADLVIFDPDATWTVDPAELHQRHALTPYAGATLRGAVRATYLRGQKIFEAGAPVGTRRGRILMHEEVSWTSRS